MNLVGTVVAYGVLEEVAVRDGESAVRKDAIEEARSEAFDVLSKILGRASVNDHLLAPSLVIAVPLASALNDASENPAETEFQVWLDRVESFVESTLNPTPSYTIAGMARIRSENVNSTRAAILGHTQPFVRKFVRYKGCTARYMTLTGKFAGSPETGYSFSYEINEWRDEYMDWNPGCDTGGGGGVITGDIETDEFTADVIVYPMSRVDTEYRSVRKDTHSKNAVAQEGSHTLTKVLPPLFVDLQKKTAELMVANDALAATKGLPGIISELRN